MLRLDPAVFTYMRAHPEMITHDLIDHLEKVYTAAINAAMKAQARREKEAEESARYNTVGLSRAEARQLHAERRNARSALDQARANAAYEAELLAGLPKEANARERDILMEVARKHRLPTEIFTSAIRGEQAVAARAEAAYRLRLETNASLPRVGMLFRRDHRTIMSSIAKHTQLVREGLA